ncbi:metallophosphoesterase [Mangrovactinospora gilvigrisea]|uniref:Metallophosphoesterase n=1 Tax=Mangrovactinospora gilvigrisea TaxID=1428644 RepID=A0A1J7BFT0_9ACTN|nr:metallophosphoesterase [Mangrovactinospora gilvigrisea]
MLLAAAAGTASAAALAAWLVTETSHPSTERLERRYSAPADQLGGRPVADTAGTTLVATAVPDPAAAGRYRPLVPGPGLPLVTRTELAPPPKAAAPATALAAFVHLTDLHIVDVQSPMRTEWIVVGQGLVGQRPQEALSVQSADALIRRINGLRGAPHTGLPLACAVTTGDNTDNQQHNELHWFLTLMSGGTVAPNSGDPHRFEGTQNSGLPIYYNPDSPLRDVLKRRGFPELPGLLDRAIRPIRAAGLRIPWYSTPGNHDNSVTGAIANSAALDRLSTGSLKRMTVDPSISARMLGDVSDNPSRAAATLAALLDPHGGSAADRRGLRTVTPDAARRPLSQRDYLAAHLDPRYTGAGPVGHGYAADDLAAGRTYYTFTVAPGVLGISLDSTNGAGGIDGTLGDAQFAWLERTLTAHAGRYYDSGGRAMRGRGDDPVVLVFSHHQSGGIDNDRPDPRGGADAGGHHSDVELRALLHRFPGVAAWVNGHVHRNTITPWRGPSPDRSFWEITTAAHIDHPTQARIIEVADHGEGTVSLWTTLIEPDVRGSRLAGTFRDLAYNDPNGAPTRRLGRPEDGNTRLLVRRA